MSDLLLKYLVKTSTKTKLFNCYNNILKKNTILTSYIKFLIANDIFKLFLYQGLNSN